jgi:hypothetical protein
MPYDRRAIILAAQCAALIAPYGSSPNPQKAAMHVFTASYAGLTRLYERAKEMLGDKQ